MATKVIDIMLPEELLADIDKEADAESRTRSELIQEATRNYLWERRWRRTQAIVAARARKAGFTTEDDVEELIDSLED